MAPAQAPESLAELATRVDARVDQLLSPEIARWSELDPDIAEPLGDLRALVLAGGKRLRPAFCYWAFVGCGGDPNDPIVVDAGASLELLHTFALVHDDVMDGSLTRRGLDAIHVGFEKRHASGGWRGEGRRFGEGVAVLVGDIAFVYADLLLANAPRRAHDIFTDLRLEVNIGQYLDLIGTVRGRPTVEAARRICCYKSGKYTIERPLHLGAALAGASQQILDELSAYGMPLGEAFQLRDDLLGVFGDEIETGKPVGGDLREGKPTSLVARAFDAAKGDDYSFLESRFGAEDLSDNEVERMRELLRSTGAYDAVELDVRRLLQESLEALEHAHIADDAKRELRELASYVAERTS